MTQTWLRRSPWGSTSKSSVAAPGSFISASTSPTKSQKPMGSPLVMKKASPFTSSGFLASASSASNSASIRLSMYVKSESLGVRPTLKMSRPWRARSTMLGISRWSSGPKITCGRSEHARISPRLAASSVAFSAAILLSA